MGQQARILLAIAIVATTLSACAGAPSGKANDQPDLHFPTDFFVADTEAPAGWTPVVPHPGRWEHPDELMPYRLDTNPGALGDAGIEAIQGAFTGVTGGFSSVHMKVFANVTTDSPAADAQRPRLLSLAFEFPTVQNATRWLDQNGCMAGATLRNGRYASMVTMRQSAFFPDLPRNLGPIAVAASQGLVARGLTPVCPNGSGLGVFEPDFVRAAAHRGTTINDPIGTGLAGETGLWDFYPRPLRAAFVATQGATTGRGALGATLAGPLALIGLRFASPDEATAWTTRHGCTGGAVLLHGDAVLWISALDWSNQPDGDPAPALLAAGRIANVTGSSIACRAPPGVAHDPAPGAVWAHMGDDVAYLPLREGRNGPFHLDSLRQQGSFSFDQPEGRLMELRIDTDAGTYTSYGEGLRAVDQPGVTVRAYSPRGPDHVAIIPTACGCPFNFSITLEAAPEVPTLRQGSSGPYALAAGDPGWRQFRLDASSNVTIVARGQGADVSVDGSLGQAAWTSAGNSTFNGILGAGRHFVTLAEFEGQAAQVVGVDFTAVPATVG